jgi:hypothetical protein
MIYSFVVIIVTLPVQAPSPTVQEQPIVQEDRPAGVEEPPLDPLRWHCPHCSWWNTYDNLKAFKIGSKQHLKRCKGPKKLFNPAKL